jgi:hypothetical protein
MRGDDDNAAGRRLAPAQPASALLVDVPNGGGPVSGGLAADRVDDWLRALGDAWEQRDPDAAAALFTEEATYRTDPHSPPHRGYGAIRAYWAGEVAGQRDVRVRFGRPLVAGDRVAVEWWTTLRDGGWGPERDDDAVTVAGTVLLRFAADGRCADLREIWSARFGAAGEPPPGWGR